MLKASIFLVFYHKDGLKVSFFLQKVIKSITSDPQA
jgi:hypothetical protein